MLIGAPVARLVIVDPAEGYDRRARAFGAETQKRLRVPTLLERGRRRAGSERAASVDSPAVG